MALTTRRAFIALWLALLLLKLWLAGAVPLFEDEAWYWLEGQHPAWAYSDLPGLTAWMARLGVAVGGDTLLGLRWPFLLVGSAIPWLVVRIASRWLDRDAGWNAGIFAMLLPLASAAGVLALPDVPLVFATLLAFDACIGLLGRVTVGASVQLALALAIGANSHYRFAIALAGGVAGLLASQEGRALLRDRRVLAALAFGALAWLPVAWFNLDEHAAGLRFQFVDRHPWRFHGHGLELQAAQPLLVGPLLYAAGMWALWQAWTRRADPRWRLLFGAAGLPLATFFALAPFIDIERVSFHWPLSSWLLVLVCVPWLLRECAHRRWNAWLLATNAMVCATLWILASQVAMPGGPERLARIGVHPKMFASLDPVVHAARARLAAMPADTELVADHFALAAKLAFALDGTRRVTTLDHRLNTKHGRALQLALWGDDEGALAATVRHPVLLVVDEDVLDFERREPWNRHVCKALPGLRDAGEIVIDDARQHYLFYRRDAAATGTCAYPSLAFLRKPLAGAKVFQDFDVEGWAFQDVVGVAKVEVLIDDRVVATARYGIEDVEVRSQWPESDDPGQPDVGFSAKVSAGDVAGREHILSLRVTGRDGRTRILERRRVLIFTSADAFESI
jgi:hypothetical protein